MGRRRIPGLTKRGGIWHINKIVNGQRICESTGTSDLQEAERYLVRRLEEIRQATVYGIRPKRSFRMAAAKYVEEAEKETLNTDIRSIKQLDPFIGHLPLESIHMGSFTKFIKLRKKQGVKKRTINHALQVTRRILRLASDEWRDEHGLTWLLAAPKIKLLPETDRRPPYPLNWAEQEKLFSALPEHLRLMALFKVNVGCRESEVCNLRWEWEIKIPELNTSVFIIPRKKVKNREYRLVVLNRIAHDVINQVRGQHSEYVFTYRGNPLNSMLNDGWIDARKTVGLPHVWVHDLKHTFGRRLRSAGVSFEDRQDLLGHKSTRITTHYSVAEIGNLIAAANKVCDPAVSSLTLTTIRDTSDIIIRDGSIKNVVTGNDVINESRAKVAQGVFPQALAATT